jgi:hypothetical protein
MNDNLLETIKIRGSPQAPKSKPQKKSETRGESQNETPWIRLTEQERARKRKYCECGEKAQQRKTFDVKPARQVPERRDNHHGHQQAI